MDLSKIKEMLKELINDSTTTEQVEQIEVVKDTSFAQKPKDEPEQPKSLEDCIQAEIEKR